MHRAQRPPHIPRTSPRLFEQHRPPLLLRLEKPLPHKSRAQPLQKRPIRLTKPIVQLIPARPERIPSILRQRRQSQTRVVSRTCLELDVAVPLRGVVFARILDFTRVGEEFLASEGADCGDLVVVPEFASAVEDGVDVEGAGGGFVG